MPGHALMVLGELGIPAFVRQAGQSIVAVMVNNMLGLYGGDIYSAEVGPRSVKRYFKFE